MSVEVNISDIPDDIKQEIISKLTIKYKNKKTWKKTYFTKKPDIHCFYVEDDKVYLPLHFCFNQYSLENDHKEYPGIEIKFTGELREPQKIIEEQVYQKLMTNRSVILSAHPGFGKTILGCHFTAKIGLLALVISHRSVIIDQWADSYNKFAPGLNIQKLTSKSVRNPNTQVMISNIKAIETLGRDFFKDVGFLIVDEVHCLCTDRAKAAYLNICPKYSLALSATAYKSDSSEKIMDFFFGQEKILKPLKIDHDVYRYNTGFIPTIEEGTQGLNWDVVLSSSANDLNRNLTIVRMCLFLKDDTIMIICKRKDQSEILFQILTELKQDVSIFVGTAKTYNKQNRILISTYSKGGTGFDNINLDCLIIGADVEEYIGQYAGRLRHLTRSKIIDLVDDLKACVNHWYSRRKYYIDTGGIIKEFDKSFPSFKDYNLEAKIEIISQ